MRHVHTNGTDYKLDTDQHINESVWCLPVVNVHQKQGTSIFCFTAHNRAARAVAAMHLPANLLYGNGMILCIWVMS